MDELTLKTTCKYSVLALINPDWMKVPAEITNIVIGGNQYISKQFKKMSLEQQAEYGTYLAKCSLSKSNKRYF